MKTISVTVHHSPFISLSKRSKEKIKHFSGIVHSVNQESCLCVSVSGSVRLCLKPVISFSRYLLLHEGVITLITYTLSSGLSFKITEWKSIQDRLKLSEIMSSLFMSSTEHRFRTSLPFLYRPGDSLECSKCRRR